MGVLKRCPWCSNQQETDTGERWGTLTCSCGHWVRFDVNGIIETSGSSNDDSLVHKPKKLNQKIRKRKK